MNLKSSRTYLLLAFLIILAVFSSPVFVCAAVIIVEGTYERFAHGSLEVRSITDCKLYGFRQGDETSKSLSSEMAFIYQAQTDYHRRFVDVIVTATTGDVVIDIAPSDSTVNADTKCLTDIGTQHLDGTVINLGFGNNGAGFDLRLTNGHTVEFRWVYDYDRPRINPKLGKTCDGSLCKFALNHVRVTFKTISSGDGLELVPLAIDPL